MKYAQVTNEGYAISFIDSTIEQPELILIDYEIPVCPTNGYRFNVNTKTWDEPTQQEAYISAVANIQTKRVELLYQSDWTQIPNGPLTQQQQEAWAVYRQQLRDIPEQSGYPFNVVWPTPP
jgi:hypothetical protein